MKMIHDNITDNIIANKREDPAALEDVATVSVKGALGM